jgi:LYR motif-containing protein 4
MMSSQAVLRLFREMLREGSRFKNYNFREYSKRRIRSEFEENKKETDPTKIQAAYEKGKRELESLKRQVSVNNLYARAAPLVVEKIQPQRRL